MVEIRVVLPEDLGAGEIAAWHAMQRSTPALANPFLCPEFAVAVGRVRPATRVAVLSDGQSPIGFFPFERRRFGAGGPIAPGLTDCQGLVHAPGAEWDARDLLRACRLSVWQFDHLVAGQRPFESFRPTAVPSPVIDLTAGFDSYLKGLREKSPQFARTLARKSRKLEREIGEIRFELDPPDKSALRLLMTWKSAQYRRTGRVDRFAQPWVVELVESLATMRGSGFRGLLSVLYAGETPVAVDFNPRFGSVLAAWFTAYDPDFAKYSPGVTQLMRLTEASAALGVTLIDLGKGAKWYKNQLKTGEVMVGEGVVTMASPLAVLHRGRVLPVQLAVRMIRRNPVLFRIADRMLISYGRMRRPAAPRRAVLPPGPGDLWPSSSAISPYCAAAIQRQAGHSGGSPPRCPPGLARERRQGPAGHRRPARRGRDAAWTSRHPGMSPCLRRAFS